MLVPSPWDNSSHRAQKHRSRESRTEMKSQTLENRSKPKYLLEVTTDARPVVTAGWAQLREKRASMIRNYEENDENEEAIEKWNSKSNITDGKQYSNLNESMNIDRGSEVKPKQYNEKRSDDWNV